MLSARFGTGRWAPEPAGSEAAPEPPANSDAQAALERNTSLFFHSDVPRPQPGAGREQGMCKRGERPKEYREGEKHNPEGTTKPAGGIEGWKEEVGALLQPSTRALVAGVLPLACGGAHEGMHDVFLDRSLLDLLRPLRAVDLRECVLWSCANSCGVSTPSGRLARCESLRNLVKRERERRVGTLLAQMRFGAPRSGPWENEVCAEGVACRPVAEPSLCLARGRSTGCKCGDQVAGLARGRGASAWTPLSFKPHARPGALWLCRRPCRMFFGWNVEPLLRLRRSVPIADRRHCEF